MRVAESPITQRRAAPPHCNADTRTASTLHVARCTLHAARCTLHVARCTLQAGARCTLHAADDATCAPNHTVIQTNVLIANNDAANTTTSHVANNTHNTHNKTSNIMCKFVVKIIYLYNDLNKY
ncbi:hypothetical protein RR46_09750 [Papilio xuthus]|uniref:Uncharacterized protein n=1 Tax=Papilio xuthus TaxID=66420 RepID=A0A194QAP8_PAPXU|nr:hypothetical protein RR46_09750 [Papilio xuthus]